MSIRTASLTTVPGLKMIMIGIVTGIIIICRINITSKDVTTIAVEPVWSGLSLKRQSFMMLMATSLTHGMIKPQNNLFNKNFFYVQHNT